MNRLMKLAALLVVPLMVACSDNNDNNNPETVNPAQLRVTHASADAPAVNVYVNGALALENVDFKQSSGLLEFAEPGTLSVEVRRASLCAAAIPATGRGPLRT